MSKVGNQRKKLSPRLRRQVVERYGYFCWYCFKDTPQPEIDHIHPLARGGTDDFSNLVTACRPCNNAKGTKTTLEWRAPHLICAECPE